MTRSAHRVFSLYPCPSRRALSARPPGLPQCRGGRGAGGAVLGHGGQRPELGAPDRSPGDHAGGTQSQRDPGGGLRLQAALGLRGLGQPDRQPQWQCRGQQHRVHRGQHAERDRRDGLPAEPVVRSRHRAVPHPGSDRARVQPLRVNLYAYAGNNPVSFSDPFGLCEQDDDACHKLVEDLRAQRGKAFHVAADRYDAIKKGRVHIVDPADKNLDPEGLNTNGNPDDFVLGSTSGRGTTADVYLRNDLSPGDRLLAGEHEGRHLAGQTHFGYATDPMAYDDYAAYRQLPRALRATAREWSDRFYGWWGPRYGKHNPFPEIKR